MKWKNWSYWVKGGILAIPISIILIFFSLFILRLLGSGGGFFLVMLPEFWLVTLGLGDRGISASYGEIVSVYAIVSFIFIARTFIIGAILGWIYGWFAKRNKRIIFLVLFVLTWIGLMSFISYRTQSTVNIYLSSQSEQDCEKTFNKGIENFDVYQCFKELAVKNKDVNVCNRIDGSFTSYSTKHADDFKWFCYEEVAHITKDSSICELIPVHTYNDFVETQRKQNCDRWFESH